MNAYLFLYTKTLKNRIRKILRKPTSIIYLIVMTLYFVWLAFTLDAWIKTGNFGSRENLARLLCMFDLYLSPLNYAAYARRKGLAFLPGDVHFLFSSPASPKGNLVYVYIKTLLSGFLISILLCVAGVAWFHMPVSRMVLYFVVCVVFDSVLQGAIVVLLYGNEGLSKGANRIFSWLLYGMIGCLAAVAAVILYREGFRFQALLHFFDAEWLGMIPLIGWSLSAMRLIVLGPSLMNVIGSLLYLFSLALLLFLAWRMPCTGQYYEDAMKFADDYQEALKKSRSGEAVVVGHRKKYRAAQIQYKGSGAKAIFYRQMLEYKKERFFLFGFDTLFYLGLGILIAYTAHDTRELLESPLRLYIIPGAMAYINVVFSSYKTRWSKELENPYVFLIPEPPFWKMWYATMTDHIRAVIHGILLAVPAMIGMGIPFWYLPLFVLNQLCMSAAGLYSHTVCRVILGNAIGETMKRVLQMFLYMVEMLLAVFAAVLVTLFVGTAAGLLTVSVYLAVLSILLAWAGSRCFVRMES